MYKAYLTYVFSRKKIIHNKGYMKGVLHHDLEFDGVRVETVLPYKAYIQGLLI